MNKVFVAIDASALRDASITRFDLNRVLIVAQGECQRVEKSVVRFSHPFANEVVGQMAVVANRDMMMTALLPRIHVVLHDMAIHTGLWVVAQIAGSVAISESEHAKAGQHA
ncbi:hypothetical protein FF011L_29370 [Roseimaritima multifibrata]|uniref:Uncharacterized protein n=1 Tax=Roseimaritima multifibrata TaxID=1930274 RepID=A0A517MH08_9BACT|nr:hypothetical protein FF011L_29370 [Roseimaritima multifibrata]